jgi:thioredoxin-related protein
MSSKNACGLGLAKIRSQHPGGAFMIVTQKGCPPCPPMKRLLKKAVGKRSAIVELPVEDAKCMPLIDRLKVTESPTIIYVKGKTLRRITEGDKTDDQIKASIATIVGGRKK